MRKSVVTALCVVIAFLLVGLGVMGYIYWAAHHGPDQAEEVFAPTDIFDEPQTFIRGISVDGVDISEMEVKEALSAINRAHVATDERFRLELKFEDYTSILEYPDITVSYNTEEILEEALRLGYSGSATDRMDERERIAMNGVKLSTEKTYTLDDVSAILNDIAEKTYVEPKDASARFDVSAPEKFVYTDGEDGRAVDLEALENELKLRLEQQRFDEPVIIPVTTLVPLVTTEQLAVKNVMISTYTTSFKKSTLGNANRVFNINRVAETINGYCVMPDEIFNINEILGPRTYELGWKGANGITDGAYEVQAGGGVCQGSSTLYNAVMMADLEVTERKPHSWPLSYIPIGRDATISTGGPNFCFRNDRETPVYVIAYCDFSAKTITCEIWGEPLPDGVSIKLDSKRTGSLKALGTKTEIDPSLGPGEKRVQREAKTGSTAETYKEYYDKDGKLIKREMCEKSTYRSIEGLVYVSAVPLEPQPTVNMAVDPPAVAPEIS